MKARLSCRGESAPRNKSCCDLRSPVAAGKSPSNHRALQRFRRISGTIYIYLKCVTGSPVILRRGEALSTRTNSVLIVQLPESVPRHADHPRAEIRESFSVSTHIFLPSTCVNHQGYKTASYRPGQFRRQSSRAQPKSRSGHDAIQIAVHSAEYNTLRICKK